MLDTHHHLWSYNAGDYPWIPDNTPLAQNQLLAELEEVTSAAGVTETIAVQARQIIEESTFLLKMADQSDLIRGIVGWLPLVSENVEKDLERFSDHPKFVGIRHVLQDEPDEYFLRNDFHRGLSKLPAHDLRYDILLYQDQIPVATKLIDRQPELGMIINHIAKPKAQNGRIEVEWRRGMKELAKRENILGVKFSGLATEFSDEDEVDPSTIRAYFQETLEIFGAERVMFGTDWPVCLLRLDSYQEWSDTVIGLTSSLSADEKDLILHKNGETAYQLKS
ncbi:MAG: amidohydrolase family protein [Akkermansiaceae bacterium]|jgi:L-fuconolactonase